MLTAQAEQGHALKRTPLTDAHAALGAKLVPFAGYVMPVQYRTGITAEHRAVRLFAEAGLVPTLRHLSLIHI